MKQDNPINRLVDQARNGNQKALESIVSHMQDDIYQMSLKMLWHPADAEDASQEILIKMITHLDSFRGESSFRTWVFRIAANHLMTAKKMLSEKNNINIDAYYEKLHEELDMSGLQKNLTSEELLLIDEVRLSCLHGLLIFLDRDLRIAFILGELFQVTSEEGSLILDISEDAYRKRLSRARKKMGKFMANTCGLIHPENPCRCENMIEMAIESKWVDPEHIVFAGHPCKEKKCFEQTENLHELDELERIALLYRNQPDFTAPFSFTDSIRQLLESGRYQLL